MNIKKEELNFYTIQGYNTHILTRETSRGGGILIYAKDKLNYEAQINNTGSMEPV